MGSYLTAFLGLSIFVTGCATAPVYQLTPSSEDLWCERDDDCTIESYNAYRCCDPCPFPPYAIAKRAVERHRSLCADRECTQKGCIVPGLESPSTYVARCIDRVCKRRPKPAP